ncbi:MAG: hypothetical protein QNI96_05215 [Woeseiaceae bacterium]|nr:hypothetical protein [Woeseiaceae bacterium]
MSGADFWFRDEGTIVLLVPTSDEAKIWCDEHFEDDGPRWGSVGRVIEPRYFEPILSGMMEAGLEPEMVV